MSSSLIFALLRIGKTSLGTAFDIGGGLLRLLKLVFKMSPIWIDVALFARGVEITVMVLFKPSTIGR